MSERLKSQYLRKREEINGHSRRYFFAGFLFSFFLLFLFYQFRSIILKPMSACEGVSEVNEVEEFKEFTNTFSSKSKSKYTQYTPVFPDMEINKILIKENESNADILNAEDVMTRQLEKTQNQIKNKAPSVILDKRQLMKPFRIRTKSNLEEMSNHRKRIN